MFFDTRTLILGIRTKIRVFESKIKVSYSYCNALTGHGTDEKGRDEKGDTKKGTDEKGRD